MCAPEGVNADTCETGWGKNRCQWGIPPVLGPLNPAIVAKSQAIADCKVAVAATFNDLRLCAINAERAGGDGSTPQLCFDGISEPVRRTYRHCAAPKGLSSHTHAQAKGRGLVCAREAELSEYAKCN
jgi:hypothetical protein